MSQEESPQYESFREIARDGEHADVADAGKTAPPPGDLLSRIEAWQTGSNGSDDDVDDDLGDFKLPDVNWESLEARLKESALEENLKQSQRLSYQLEREEIRRKLAMVSSSSSSSSSNDPTIAAAVQEPEAAARYKSSTKPGQNLQICFMNESLNDDSTENDADENEEEEEEEIKMEHFEHRSDDSNDDEDGSELGSDTEPAEECPGAASAATVAVEASSLKTPSFATFSFDCGTSSCEDVLLKLQRETQEALAQVKPQVKQKLEADRQAAAKKPSPIADIVGLSTYGLKRLERRQMAEMNIGQLQVIVNDLCNQIEKINEELKKMLIDRDDLYMQQDAILVDVEDFTKRIQEIAQKKATAAASTASTKTKTPSPSGTLTSYPSSSSLKSFPTLAMAAGSKVSAFFSQYTQESSSNTGGAAESSSSSTTGKLLSSLTSKLYAFKK